MKAITLSILALVGLLVASCQTNNTTPSFYHETESPAKDQHSLHAVIYQDLTGSIERNGVEVVDCSIFTPYFNLINRDVQLEVGIIDSMSSEQLINVSLPAWRITNPIIPDLTNLSITDKRKGKDKYTDAYNKYIQDSIQYFHQRQTLINEFCHRIDARIAIYDKLAGITDLISAIEIADRSFEFSAFPSPKKYLLIYSDGFDSFGRNAIRLRNSPEVILINAAGNTKTSLDSIITLRLTSPAQAIQYTIHN